jgi:PAS domain S-box-containing protein
LPHGRPVAALNSRIDEANKLNSALKYAAEKLSAAEITRTEAEARQRAAYQQSQEEKARAEALFDQRERIFEANPNGLLVVDEAGRIQSLNERLATSFGYPREQLIGKSVELLVPKRFRDRASLRATFVAAPSSTKMGVGRDLYGLRRDGTEFPIEIGLSPFSADCREMTLGTIVDVTERKRAERALLESAARQAALYELVDRLHRADSMTAVYDAALDAMQTALECGRASILLRDSRGAMRFVGWRGLSDTYRQAVEGHSPWSPEETNPQPVYLANIAAAELDESLKAVIGREGIAALAFIPLVVGGELIGKFMTYYEARHSFSDDERDVSLTIARKLSLTIARKRGEEALRQAERRLETALQAGRMGAWEWNIDTGQVVWSPGLEQIHGLMPGTFGGTFEDFKKDIHPGDLESVLALIEQAVQMRRGYHVTYRVIQFDGAVRWLESFGTFILGTDARPQRLAGVCIDITERKRAEEREKLLTNELQHRTKNLFAVVQALAIRTFRGDAIIDEARQTFLGRLHALARANQSLTNFARNGTNLKDLVHSELEAFGDRIKIDGVDVQLGAWAAQNFALAIHELGTNAAKHGALSKSGGEVLVDWKFVDDAGNKLMKFRWQERGGPPVTFPQHNGFGITLLQSTLGQASIQYPSQGLSYEIELPLSTIMADSDEVISDGQTSADAHTHSVS